MKDSFARLSYSLSKMPPLGFSASLSFERSCSKLSDSPNFRQTGNFLLTCPKQKTSDLTSFVFGGESHRDKPGLGFMHVQCRSFRAMALTKAPTVWFSWCSCGGLTWYFLCTLSRKYCTSESVCRPSSSWRMEDEPEVQNRISSWVLRSV